MTHLSMSRFKHSILLVHVSEGDARREMSSSAARALLHAKESVEGLLPKAVAAYVREHGLYAGG